METSEFQYLIGQDALLRSQLGELRAVLRSQQQLLESQDAALISQQALIETLTKAVDELRRPHLRSTREISGPVH